MQIILNNNFLEVEPGTTLAALLQSQQLHTRSGLAVALNNKVVPRPKWETTPLSENDSVLLIGATYGG